MRQLLLETMMQIKKAPKKVEIALSLKHLSNFWETLDMPLINCKVSLALSWSENCVITRLETRLITAAVRR